MIKGLLLVALAALSWGTTGTMAKLIGASSAEDALLVGAIRMFIAGPLLLAAAWTRGERLGLGRGGFVIAGLCMAAYQVCYFMAVPMAGVAASALLAICSAPIFVAVLAYLTLHETMTAPRLGALAIGTTGAALLVGGTSAEAGPRFGWGVLLALASGLAYSIYAVISKRLVEDCQPLALSGLTFSAGAAALAPLVGLHWASAAALMQRGGLQLVYLGVVATAAAYWLYTTALRSIPAGSAVIAGLLEPLAATILGLVLFHETLSATGIAGAVLLVSAVLLLGLPGTPRTWRLAMNRSASAAEP